VIEERFPEFADVEIPPQITDNVTLSTMHGCPPDEIESIARYLLEGRGLHTAVKLNPTLLGQDAVMRILHHHLGWREIAIPDRVFAHDLQYDRAVTLIRALQEVAAAQGLTYGIKLSNTLAMANHRDVLPGDEMYMSGRALYPITINLFHKLAREFDGDLSVSFSAGADALNVTSILAAGACPVTAVSDLLKPGGYSRFLQYLENLEQAMRGRGVTSLEELARDKLANLAREAARSLEEPRYKKAYHPYGLPKVESDLDLFDCIAAPCVAQCAVLQDVPEYAWLISRGEYDRALEVILARNPLPGATGYACTHLCETRCTRNNYDQPVAIRALKRFANEWGTVDGRAVPRTGRKVAVVGSGPSGLAAAYFLALAGVEVTIYEARERAGGMLAIAPTFRLPESVVREDIQRIQRLGVEIELAHPIVEPPERLLEQGFDAVYVSSGAGGSALLGIEGEEGEGVFVALDFLQQVGRGERVNLGERVLVIGGGNTAMDAARTARRLTGGSVTVVYRRTQREMPATEEEIEGLLAEGCILEELASPTRIVLEGGRVAALECVRNKLGDPGVDGRRRPVPIKGSEFSIPADSVVVAVGQRPDISFLDGSVVSLHKDGTIVVDGQTGLAGGERVYAGGDAVRGPAIIVEACADGRRAAEAMLRQLGLSPDRPVVQLPTLSEEQIVGMKRARVRRMGRQESALLPPEQRDGFDLVEATLTEEAAQQESARCVQCSSFCDKCVEVCPNRANFAVTVSPMSLSLPRLACQQGELAVVGQEDFEVTQVRQIIHVHDFCNECGNCTTFCVHRGRPYADKPRLFLDRHDFEQESDNAFWVERGAEGWTIYRREGARETHLHLAGQTGEMTFEAHLYRVVLSPGFHVRTMELKQEFDGSSSLTGAAEMAVILRGIISSMPFLPI
jgi:putative selenate reductase